MIDLKETKYLGDVSAKHGVEIDIRQDGLVCWINVDGVCVARILTNGVTVPITVIDNRKEICLNYDQSKQAASNILDYTDNNLTKMEACDMPEECLQQAKSLYNAAKTLKELFK